jgi:hypothetical protein
VYWDGVRFGREYFLWYVGRRVDTHVSLTQGNSYPTYFSVSVPSYRGGRTLSKSADFHMKVRPNLHCHRPLLENPTRVVFSKSGRKKGKKNSCEDARSQPNDHRFPPECRSFAMGAAPIHGNGDVPPRIGSHCPQVETAVPLALKPRWNLA